MFNESPGIIVRFVRRDVRNNIYFQRKYLGNNISVFEHLTGPNKSLLREAREAVGEQNAWSCKGKLFISTAGRKKQFKCSQDIVKFSKPPSSQSNSGSTPTPGNSEGKHTRLPKRPRAQRPRHRPSSNKFNSRNQNFQPSRSPYWQGPAYITYLKDRALLFNIPPPNNPQSFVPFQYYPSSSDGSSYSQALQNNL